MLIHCIRYRTKKLNLKLLVSKKNLKNKLFSYQLKISLRLSCLSCVSYQKDLDVHEYLVIGLNRFNFPRCSLWKVLWLYVVIFTANSMILLSFSVLVGRYCPFVSFWILFLFVGLASLCSVKKNCLAIFTSLLDSNKHLVIC